MFKPVVILALMAIIFIFESSAQRFIQPTYRPPPPPKRPVIYRLRRSNDEPLWLYKGDIPRAPATGDHPFLPKYIDDIKLDPNRRVARSLGTPSVSRAETRQPTNRDTGATHPGYNRRNARNIPDLPRYPTLPPFNPKPRPSPWDPKPVRFPILARN